MIIFRNRRMRSKINFQILKILAFQTTPAILAAEVYHLCKFALSAPRSVSALKALESYDEFYIYLYRLHCAGFVKIAGLKRQKKLYLTRKGRKAVETLLKEEEKKVVRVEKKIEIDPKKDKAIGKVLSWIREHLNPHRKYIGMEDRMEMREKMAKACAKENSAMFISYDIPEEFRVERQMLSMMLKGIGFVRMHESFYLGEARQLKEALESIEDLGLLPYVCWGKVNFMHA